MQTFGRFMEAARCRLRRRAVRKSLHSLRRHLFELSEPGCDVDRIGIEIYRDIASIELNSGATPGEKIWV